MNIDDLKIFLAITELGTFNKVAKATHNSISKVSRAVLRIENELNVKIFEHKKHGVVLNFYGEILKEKAREIIGVQNSLRETVDYYRFRNPNAIKIESCDPGPAWFLSHQLNKANPYIDNEANMYKDFNIAFTMLKDDLVDVLITDAPVDARGYTCKFLARDELVLTVHKDDERFKETRQISLMDGRIKRLYIFDMDCPFMRKLNRVLDKISSFKEVFYEDKYFVFQTITERRDTIFTNTRLVSEYRKDGTNLKLIPLTDLGLDIKYYLVYKNSNKEQLEKVLQITSEMAEKFK